MWTQRVVSGYCTFFFINQLRVRYQVYYALLFGQDGWILAKLFFNIIIFVCAFLWTEMKSSSIKTNMVNTKTPTILTEQAWAVNKVFII